MSEDIGAHTGQRQMTLLEGLGLRMLKYPPNVMPADKSPTRTATAAAHAPKKRGFDIASLVENDDVPDKRRKTASPGDEDGGGSSPPRSAVYDHSESKSAFRAPLNPPAARNQPSAPPPGGGLPAGLLSSLAAGPLGLPPVPTGFPSAFKKVDKTSVPSSVVPSPFDLVSSLYTSARLGAASNMTPGLFHGQSALPPMMSPAAALPPPVTSLGSSPSTNNSRGDAAASNGKSLISPSLLPFLPPSLAALSFPQTNWCAKCNASKCAVSVQYVQ